MATTVVLGHDTSGTTAARPTNVEPGFVYFDTDVGQSLTWDGDAWIGTGGGIVAQEVTFTETTGAGTYTGSVSVPAGATLIDVVIHGTAVWNTATSATMKVGDVADDDGIFTGIDLKATDLLAAEGLSVDQAGGKAGADIANSQWNRRYLATARVISGIVTTVGATGTLGRTRMTVIYNLPSTPIAATKA